MTTTLFRSSHGHLEIDPQWCRRCMEQVGSMVEGACELDWYYEEAQRIESQNLEGYLESIARHICNRIT